MIQFFLFIFSYSFLESFSNCNDNEVIIYDFFYTPYKSAILVTSLFTLPFIIPYSYVTLFVTWSSFLFAFAIFIVSDIFILNFYTAVFWSSSYWPCDIIDDANEIDACYLDNKTK